MRVLKHHRTFEVALHQAGLGPVAGVDEAGRGACAGPITIAACILPPQPLAALSRFEKTIGGHPGRAFPAYSTPRGGLVHSSHFRGRH